MDMVSEGDGVMADRGFNVRDLLTAKKAHLIMPAFTRKCSHGKGKMLTSSEIWETRRIAHHRIHVERAIERLKTFRLLSQVIPLDLKPIADKMLIVACGLCNYQKPLC
jgi:hypothetical protein